jgi:hypothetical protein
MPKLAHFFFFMGYLTSLKGFFAPKMLKSAPKWLKLMTEILKMPIFVTQFNSIQSNSILRWYKRRYGVPPQYLLFDRRRNYWAGVKQLLKQEKFGNRGHLEAKNRHKRKYKLKIYGQVKNQYT